MINNTPALIILVALVQGVAGCGGYDAPSNPVSPTVQTVPSQVPAARPPAAQPVGPQFTLSGLVFEVTPTGQVPLADVVLYCETCGEIGIGHTFAYTDSNGRYSFAGAFNGNNPLQVKAKEGYQAADGRTLGPDWTIRDVLVNGDTRFDVQLVKR